MVEKYSKVKAFGQEYILRPIYVLWSLTKTSHLFSAPVSYYQYAKTDSRHVVVYNVNKILRTAPHRNRISRPRQPKLIRLHRAMPLSLKSQILNSSIPTWASTTRVDWIPVEARKKLNREGKCLTTPPFRCAFDAHPENVHNSSESKAFLYGSLKASAVSQATRAAAPKSVNSKPALNSWQNS